MKYVKTFEQYDEIQITLKGDKKSKTFHIKKSDIIKGGRFKNKKITVKSIDINDKGDITINDRPFSKFRQ
jgi:hypothetical protein